MIRALLLATTFASAVHGETPADFSFGMPLSLQGDTAFYRVEVPDAAYQAAMLPGLRDVRVFNADDARVPHALLPRALPVREKRPSTVLPAFPLRTDRETADVNGLALTVTRNAGGTSISLVERDGASAPGRRLVGYVLDASALTEPMTALTITLPQVDGGTTTRMRVEASDDLVGWRMLVPDAPVLDLEFEGRRLTRDRVELPPTKAKYLRLSSPRQQPVLEFGDIRAEIGERSVEAPRHWRDVPGASVAEHEGDFEFDLGGIFPVDRITIDLPEQNSVAPAQLFARGSPKDPWLPVVASVFYRLRQADGEVTNVPVAIAETERRYWLLRVDPKAGGVGTGPPRLRAGWRPDEIVFAARGPAPFEIVVGSATAIEGALPIATLVPGYDRASALPANVGMATAGPPARVGNADQKLAAAEVRRWALWASLILGALMLGYMAWRLSRQLGAAPPANTTDSGGPPAA